MKQNKDMESLFEHARQQQPVILIHEVEALLSHKLAGTGSSGRHQKSSFKKTIIMSSLFITSIITLIIKLATNDTQVNLQKQSPGIANKQHVAENISVPVAPPPAPGPLNSPQPIPARMNGLNLLQATPGVLAKLGVISSLYGVAVPTDSKGDYFTYSKDGTYIGIPDELEAELARTRAWLESHQSDSAMPYPVLVTDDLGQNWRAYHDFSNGGLEDLQAEVRERINTLVPVLVRTSDVYTELDKANKRWRPDVILWYEPTAAFLACLPSSTSSEILWEARAIARGDSVNLNIQYTESTADTSLDQKPARRSYKYFEVWRSDNRIMEQMQVYPNPTEGSFTTSVNLRYARTLSISVMDISGKVVSILYKDQVQETGNREYACDISALNPGLYILFVETEKGEKFTQRIIRK